MNQFTSIHNLIILSTLLMLAGCEEKARTVEWYMAHENECTEKIEKCNIEEMKMLLTPSSEPKEALDCKNARKAAFKRIDEKARKRREKYEKEEK